MARPSRNSGVFSGWASALAAASLWLAALAAVPASAAESPAEASATAGATSADPVQAIWKHQEIGFYFQSFTTFYSCTGLEAKLERIMRELGVHAKVRVRSADCPASVARMPRVTMRVVGPVEATPEELAERDKNKSVRELTERVRGKKNAHPFDSLEQFPAQWQRVSLTRGRLDLQPGDCELIEELQKKVLPKLAVRIVKDDVQCSPNQLTLGQPRLEVDALMELPKPDQKAGEQPGEGN
ncbi:hypothetical protein [Steroidobacter sp.]|uniref:hypothetical protein n=1 Tax=Steroidobacter sp. TaxID=1978227 RepID=UPI001A48F97D|nr:hypothetical protein [Steroidobacter sp.]MBL8270009.1 hypothetical protein [Steroidobacter sp.]